MQQPALCAYATALVFTALAQVLPSASCRAAGVTLITHGFNGNVDGWITGMANHLPAHPGFPGTNGTVYRIEVDYSGGVYSFTTTRTAGSTPANTDSGEIIVKLDWSSLATVFFGAYASTENIGRAVGLALLQTNLTAELEGHALAEYPLHLVGHSRGGSLVSEISRVLGTNGLWVDHLTTIDPHPVNNDGNSDFPFSFSDAPVRSYATVLFHDNYWEDLDWYIHGAPVSGAYVRKLDSLGGGYDLAHSDTHLWYHGTIDTNVPATDTEAWIDAGARAAWWVAYENSGSRAGFYYSRIGGGDRLSMDQPLGPGFAMIRDGLNQQWDFGAGTAGNRTLLNTNHGAWPSLIGLDRSDTNAVSIGGAANICFQYQWAQPATSNAILRVYLDNDLNPLNANSIVLTEFGVPGTTAVNVSLATVAVPIPATNTVLGWHALGASISAGGRTRHLYARDPILLVPPASLAPVLDIALADARIELGISGVTGQRIVLQTSADIMSWQPLATNILQADRWVYLDGLVDDAPQRFYRALLVP